MTVYNEKYNSDKRKLHAEIPTELWGILFAKNDLNRIDDLLTELLCKYYGVELNGRNKKQ